MAAGLELRVPFLDLELMRFVERIPATERVTARSGKRLHREAMAKLLPPGIAGRPKHGFATPYDDWLRASLGNEVEQRYRVGTALAELVQPAAVTKLGDEHRRGRADHKAVLYCLLELSEWHACFVEAREPVAA
jgi:asparagine synthase (glutamine-hydrolysing)